jgi:hypothetical protein
MHNKICITLFICILVVLLGLIIKWISSYIFKIFGVFGFSTNSEGFYYNRNTRIKIFQSDEIFDPDELPEIEDIDPDDDPINFDPDQQHILDDEEKSITRRGVNEVNYF